MIGIKFWVRADPDVPHWLIALKAIGEKRMNRSMVVKYFYLFIKKMYFFSKKKCLRISVTTLPLTPGSGSDKSGGSGSLAATLIESEHVGEAI